MVLTIENLGRMTPKQAQAFLKKFDAALMRDNGAAARAHLAAGNPIYYCKDDTPDEMVIKKYPDGRKQLVRMEGETEIVVSELPAE
jgi:hypothetical protein